jgi:hypothetical protein
MIRRRFTAPRITVVIAVLKSHERLHDADTSRASLHTIIRIALKEVYRFTVFK